MTNFQYLTELNKMAGRSFNDLMQYPVFPFVLADFGREVLDLNDFKTFRYHFFVILLGFCATPPHWFFGWFGLSTFSFTSEMTESVVILTDIF